MAYKTSFSTFTVENVEPSDTKFSGVDMDVSSINSVNTITGLTTSSQMDTFTQNDILEQATSNATGADVSIMGASGTILIIGSPLGSTVGSVDIFEFSEGSWSLSQTLSGTKRFGSAISIANDTNQTLVVGAYNISSNTGRIWIHENTEGTWVETNQLDGAGTSDYYGQSVRITRDGTVLFVGAKQGSGVSTAGSVYIYVKGEDDWKDVTSETQEIQSTSPTNSDFFGEKIDCNIDGTRLAVCARQEDTGASNAGAVFIFEESGGSWTETQQINAPNGATANGYFGRSVAMTSDGSVLVIGETGVSSVYIYRYSGGTYSLGETVRGSESTTGTDNFGISCAISDDGTVLLVGANTHSSGQGMGYFFTYDSISESWIERKRVQSSSPSTNEYFGTTSSTCCVGLRSAFGSTYSGTSGEVYVYDSTATEKNITISSDLKIDTGSELICNSSIKVPALATDPVSDLADGQIFYNSTLGALRVYHSSAWNNW